MSHNTIVHSAVRPVVRLLAKTPVTPDHLTALRFLTGLAAALIFTLGPAWLAIGSAVFLLSAFLDRADGELARQTQRFSQHGHRYDLIADWSATALVFIGIGLGARGGWLGLAAPVLGVLAGIGVTVVFSGIHILHVASLPGQTPGGGRVLVDPDDSMFLVPVLLLAFGAPSVLLPAGTLTPLLAGLMLWRLWVSRRAATPGNVPAAHTGTAGRAG